MLPVTFGALKQSKIKTLLRANTFPLYVFQVALFMSQYFTLFKLEPRFDIDLTILEKNYLSLATQTHPDKFVATSAFEQKQAMMMATTVNEAYSILKSPLNRAAYLLSLQGINADAAEHTQFAPEFLMQQMEWREALEDARAERNEPALEALSHTIIQAQQTLYQQIQTTLTEPPDYETAAQLVRQGRFFDKLKNEIQAALP